MKRVLILVSALMALIVTLAACGEDATFTPPPTATPVPQINQVTFSAFDYGFRGPDSIPAGMTTLTLLVMKVLAFITSNLSGCRKA